ncbi:hypothetical protein MASR2M17_03440 [Aminivibrio sp.]
MTHVGVIPHKPDIHKADEGRQNDPRDDRGEETGEDGLAADPGEDDQCGVRRDEHPQQDAFDMMAAETLGYPASLSRGT